MFLLLVPGEKLTSTVVRSNSKRSLTLDLWKDAFLLASCIPPFRRPEESICQLVTCNKEVVDIPVGVDIGCDEVIFNMNMLDHQTQTSKLTGNYDVDFPDLKTAWNVHLVQKKNKKCSLKGVSADFCVVRSTDVEEDVPIDMSTFESLDCPEEVPDEWEIIDHPKPSNFELVHGGVSSRAVPSADGADMEKKDGKKCSGKDKKKC